MDNDKETELEPILGWHDIHGAPYFIRWEDQNIFYTVKSTSTVLRNGSYFLCSDIDMNLPELILEKILKSLFQIISKWVF